MRLILSRKGFDSAYGGVPSPILPNGQLLSLPIPELGSSRHYGELSCKHRNVGEIVEQLTQGAISRTSSAHLDPDLDPETCTRSASWRPAFGQSGAAARHLDKQGVGVGDLFLFFGWFRQTELVAGRLRFVPDAHDKHVIFGWLRVGEVAVRPVPGLEQHPHFRQPPGAPYAFSRVYVAPSKSGGGVFRTFDPRLQLTVKRGTRSEWLLPHFFLPRDRTPLSYHGNPLRWKRTAAGVRLRAVSRGQEFVLNADAYDGALDWARSLGARVP